MKIKAILIDAENRKIVPVEVEKDGIKDYYKFIKCECFTVAGYFKNGAAIFVDDEGLFRSNNFFQVANSGFSNYQPFAGNGLIVSSNEEGEAVDCDIALKSIKIRFMDRQTVALIASMSRN